MLLTRKLLMQASVFAACALMSHHTYAATKHQAIKSEDFDNAQEIDDKDLSKMRGGFNVGGLNISFTFSSVGSINGAIQPALTYSFNSNDLQNALNKAKNIHVTPPVINVPAVNVQVDSPVITVPGNSGQTTQIHNSDLTAGVQDNSITTNTSNTPNIPAVENIEAASVTPPVNAPVPPTVNIPVQPIINPPTPPAVNPPAPTTITVNIPTNNQGIPATSDSIQTLQNIIRTNIIQNDQNGALITVNQTLDMNISNASITAQANSNTIGRLAAFQSSIQLR